jgi:hypothetical protein
LFLLLHPLLDRATAVAAKGGRALNFDLFFCRLNYFVLPLQSVSLKSFEQTVIFERLIHKDNKSTRAGFDNFNLSTPTVQISELFITLLFSEKIQS